MVTLHQVEQKLAGIGFRNKFWGRPEVRELRHILTPSEQIIAAVNGHYEHGFALLVATNRRILLIDKKWLFVSMEDLRYDMISEVDYSASAFTASLTITTINKQLFFTSIRQKRLRALTAFMQQQVMELRQMTQGEYAQPAAAQQNTNRMPVQAAPAQPYQPVIAPNELSAQAVNDLGMVVTEQVFQQNTTPELQLPRRTRSPFPSVPLTVRRSTPRF